MRRTLTYSPPTAPDRYWQEATSEPDMAINGWRLIERIGAGGMGEVWRARHARMGVGALKLLREELLADREARSRFRREARTLRRIDGLCAARVLDVDLEGDSPYIVTEYVAGPTLRFYIARTGPVTDAGIVRAFALGLAEGLVAVHEAGVVHRDLTATNVLLARNGPKIVDFGIARYVDALQVTTSALSIGTPGWMSPEQILGDDVGPPSDMFCWGLLVCFAAGGRNVFGVGSPEALLYRIVHEEPAVPGLPDDLAELVPRALIKDPAVRPTAADVLRSIEYDVGATAAEFLQQTWRQHSFDVRRTRGQDSGRAWDGPHTAMVEPPR
jgi:serine/threonine protein kinase